MSLIFFWRCEGETLDGTDDYTAGDGSATSLNSASISDTADRIGTSGILSAASQGSLYNFDTDIWPSYGTPGLSAGAAAFSFNYRTAVPAGLQAHGIRVRGASSTLNLIGVLTGSSQELVLRVGNTSASVDLSTTSANLSADTWYGCVIRWDLANNKRAIEVYDSSNALIQAVDDVATDLSTYIPSALDGNVQLGIKSSSNANPVWFDNFFIADDYDEPLEDYLTITSYGEYGPPPPAGGDLVLPQFYQRTNTLLRM